jgi:hypothetical protein
MQVNDDLILGAAANLVPVASSTMDPTLQGFPPMGRVAFHNVIPLTKQTANVAALQHTTAATGLTLAAGTGATAGVAPDGSGRAVIIFDTPRCVSLTSSADMHTNNVTVTGFDQFGRLTTQTRALGSSATTVNTTKALLSILSVVPSATDGTNNMSVGTADIFGLPVLVADAGYILPSWGETLGLDAGTFVAGDATSPATASTGDPRGTYAPSSASNGTRRLVTWIHLPGTAVGPAATLIGLIGQTPV